MKTAQGMLIEMLMKNGGKMAVVDIEKNFVEGLNLAPGLNAEMVIEMAAKNRRVILTSAGIVVLINRIPFC